MILLTLGYPVFIYIIIHSEKKDTWDKNISIISEVTKLLRHYGES